MTSSTRAALSTISLVFSDRSVFRVVMTALMSDSPVGSGSLF